MNRLAAIGNWINDRTNPIVIKELRQAVQSRLVIAILLVFLAVNVFVVCAFLMLNADANSNESAGQELFAVLFVVVALTCLVFVPLYAGIRLTMEQNDANIDLLFTTTIPPAAIIRGKFWAAVALTALIYRACMPFLTFTYLLRGIDLPSIFASLAMAFACTAGVTMLAIFVGSVAGGWLLRLLLGGAFLFAWCWITGMVLIGGVQVAQMGLNSMFNNREAWAVFGCFVLFGLCAWGFFYLLAVASISARSSNRMLPVRSVRDGLLARVWRDHGHLELDRTESAADRNLANDQRHGAQLRAGLRAGRAQRRGRRARATVDSARRIPATARLALLHGFGRRRAVVLHSWRADAARGPALEYDDDAQPLAVHHRENDGRQHRRHGGRILYAVSYGMTGLLVRRWLMPKSPPILRRRAGLHSVRGRLPGADVVGLSDRRSAMALDDLPVEFVLTNPASLGREFAALHRPLFSGDLGDRGHGVQLQVVPPAMARVPAA